MERTSPPADLAALRHATGASSAIILLVELITRDPQPMLHAAAREQTARVLDEMADILRAGGYPADVTFDAEQADLPPLEAAVSADLREAIINFAAPPQGTAPHPNKASGGGFFLPDAFTNQAHVRYALKTTAAAMFCYCLYTLLDWPAIHTCFITCYIVALTTAAEAVEKLTLRMLGCLLGAAVGIVAIVFVMPSLTSIGTLMAVVFVGAFASAWVAVGSPRIAYAGFQIAFAFLLCVLQGPTPEFDMTVARDRVIGVLVGNVVSYLVFTRVWPVSIAQRIDPAIGALLRRLSAMTTSVGIAARRSVAMDVLASHEAIENDLLLVAYEPSWIRPPRGWQGCRLVAMRAILALTGPLLLSADRSPAVSVEFNRRLRDAARAPGDAEPAQSDAPGDAVASATDRAQAEAVRTLLDQDCRRLEQAMAECHAPV